MKIIQITDLHIGKAYEDTSDVDVRQNFLNVLKEVKAAQPDHLVITGDFCYQVGELEVYNWIKAHLDFLNLPYDVISGNHDDTLMMAKAFQIEHLLIEDELFYKKLFGKRTILFLDTAKYFLSKVQLEWLAHELAVLEEELIIFMHHPPILAGVPFMDNKHALKNWTDFQRLAFQYAHPIHVFCGHYHVDKTAAVKNLNVHITPACFFQIDWREIEFKVDHHRIAFREIELLDNGIRHGLRYLDGNILAKK